MSIAVDSPMAREINIAIRACRLKRHTSRAVEQLLPTNLALQLQFFPEMGFARVGLMGPTPRRPCEDMGVRDAPLGKLHG
ncbi:hypothetical protein, partial [Bradyrhizobium sp. BRP19]|uniref:hypothetical protein n=1 Tax=Bradyrhizobium sp. BRP19 TaxID=2793823 RepID=UPI001CD1C6CA